MAQVLKLATRRGNKGHRECVYDRSQEPEKLLTECRIAGNALEFVEEADDTDTGVLELAKSLFQGSQVCDLLQIDHTIRGGHQLPTEHLAEPLEIEMPLTLKIERDENVGIGALQVAGIDLLLGYVPQERRLA